MFNLSVVETTPPVPTKDWYRFWRVDSRKIRGLGDVMLFMNYETLFTFVADTRPLRQEQDVVQHFLNRYSAMFKGHLGYGEGISEKVVFHRASDRSVQGVMNSFFLVIEGRPEKATSEALEEGLNNAPIISRKFRFSSELLNERLRGTA
jgi:hypothetical protein